jgi:hypothetical protein
MSTNSNKVMTLPGVGEFVVKTVSAGEALEQIVESQYQGSALVVVAIVRPDGSRIFQDSKVENKTTKKAEEKVLDLPHGTYRALVKLAEEANPQPTAEAVADAEKK